MTHKIYAPNIHLFAFHLRNASSSDSQPDTDYNSELLWHKYDQICAKFQIQQKLDLRDVAEGSRIALLTGATTDNILLPLEGKLSLNNGKGIRITGQACPLQIYDSYALGLNIRIPERENNQKTEDVDLTIFKDFNPDQCFLPSKINSNIKSSLGQILLLTAWLPQKQQQDSHVWKEIADQCVHNFLGEKNQDNYPPLYREGQLFDSPIFEYGIPDKSQDYGQIFVWLFLGEEVNGNYGARADENFSLFYQYFIDLFFYRQKVIKAYQISREVYSDVKQQYQEIKKIINETAQIKDNQSLQPDELTSLPLAASPLNPPILGDFNSSSPQNWGARGAEDFNSSSPQNWGARGAEDFNSSSPQNCYPLGKSSRNSDRD
ncbi:MAG: hypothetical protein F6J98_12290 [Moorea sp. SIO4G2]|nr:hypothetical protein [Moorena sp. SIO4G2]